MSYDRPPALGTNHLQLESICHGTALPLWGQITWNWSQFVIGPPPRSGDKSLAIRVNLSPQNGSAILSLKRFKGRERVRDWRSLTRYIPTSSRSEVVPVPSVVKSGQKRGTENWRSLVHLIYVPYSLIAGFLEGDHLLVLCSRLLYQQIPCSTRGMIAQPALSDELFKDGTISRSFPKAASFFFVCRPFASGESRVGVSALPGGGRACYACCARM